MNKKILYSTGLFLFVILILVSLSIQEKDYEVQAHNLQVVNLTPTPTLVYRWPWPDGEAVKFSQSWHSKSEDSLDFLRNWSGAPTPPDLSILALADGKVSTLCGNSELDTALYIINHGSMGQSDSQELWYVHVRWSSVPQWIKDAWNANKEVKVVQGQFLGEMKPGGIYDTRCSQEAYQKPTNAHLHLAIKNKDITIDGWRIRSTDGRCFKKGNEDYCAGELITSNTISINCDANQPYIGSRLCRRRNTLIRPEIWRESIEFFDKPFGSNTGEIALGTIRSGGLCKVIGGPEVNGTHIGWLVECPSASIDQIHQDFDMRDGVWVNEADIEEVTRSSFTEVQFASVFFPDIELSKYLNIFHGFSTGRFGYKEDLTRGDMALTAYRTIVGEEPTCSAIGMTTGENGICTGDVEPAFSDVTTFDERGQSENIAIQWMAEQDPPVVNGTVRECPENPENLPCFFPERTITKGEFTKIAMGTFRTTDVYDQIDVPECTQSFSDVTEDDPFKPFIDEACGLGFFEGYMQDGVLVFGRNDKLLREHGAKLLWRVYYELRNPRQSTAQSVMQVAPQQSTPNGEEDNPDFFASQEVLDLRWALMSANRGKSDEFCQLYFVDDSDSNNSQFGRLNLAVMQDNIQAFGPLHENFNFESVEIDPITKRLYAVTGNHGNRKSQLFRIDPYFGTVRLIDTIQYPDGSFLEGVDSLTFLPNGDLYGYASKGNPEARGIIKINLDTAVASLVAQFDPPAGRQIEGMAYELNTNRFWLVAQKDFYSWQPGNSIEFEFKLNGLPGTIEALEFIPNGQLLAGIHHGGKLNIYTIDVSAGEIRTIEGYDTGNFGDIEGLAFPDWCQAGYPVIKPVLTEGDKLDLPHNGVNITWPANQTAKVFSLIHTEAANIPSNEISTGNAFRFTAYGTEGSELENYEFVAQASLVEIQYSGSASSNIYEHTLVLKRWNGQSWEPASCGQIEHDLENNRIRVPICNTGEFLLSGIAIQDSRLRVYLPIVMK